MLKRLSRSLGVQCLLRQVVVVERDIAVQGLLQVLAGPEVVRAQQVRDAPVEALDHAIGLRVARGRQTVLDAQFLAQAIELMRPGRGPRPAPEQPVRELGAVVGEQARDAHRAGRGQGTEEGARRARALVGFQGHVNPAGGPIDGHEQEPAPVLVGHLRQVLHVDVHKAGHVGLEGLADRFVRRRAQGAQVAHAVAAQAAVQPGAGHVRTQELARHRQQVVQRQQQGPAQVDHDRLLAGGQRRLQAVRGVRPVVDIRAPLPFVDRRLGDAKAAGQHRHRLITGRDLRPHVGRGAGLFVQCNQHADTSRSTAFPSPASSRNTSRASSSGDRDGTI
ncbi:hypothetical protein PG2T_03955 [Immundisolibacter cernigliae]|uniref:Uncharacterized protein n=1 Tax=Immundisolibacter cernigliae TaxID=1810504 RepID=A0A1B1YRK6_9GAMM|nr:hypothetical protein PG2T_03955 [Immundisolibacter cernigliae]